MMTENADKPFDSEREKALLQAILKEIQICRRILRGEKVDDESHESYSIIEKKGIMDFGEPNRESMNDFFLPSLSGLIGRVFVIQSVRWGEDQYGQYAVVETDDGYYKTNEMIICNQLKNIEKMLKTAGGVRVKLIRNNMYLMFIAPS